MRQALQRYRDRLEPGDVLRMLRLLAESESGIRRSVNPRLIVETLLLRWTMLDRIVDLAQVLGAARPPQAAAGRGRRQPATRRGGRRTAGAAGGSRAAPGRRLRRGARHRSATGRPSPGCRPGSRPRSRRSGRPGPTSSPRCARRSRFLGEALAATTPAALELPWLTVALAEPNPLVRRAVAGAGSGGGGGAAAEPRPAGPAPRHRGRRRRPASPPRPPQAVPRRASRPIGCGVSGPRIRPSTRRPMR